MHDYYYSSFLPCLRPGHFPFTSLIIIIIVLLKRLWGFTFWRNCAAQWSGETWKFGIKWIDTLTVKIPQLEDYRARSFLPWRRPNAWKVSFIIFLAHPYRLVRYQLLMFYIILALENSYLEMFPVIIWSNCISGVYIELDMQRIMTWLILLELFYLRTRKNLIVLYKTSLSLSCLTKKKGKKKKQSLIGYNHCTLVVLEI